MSLKRWSSVITGTEPVTAAELAATIRGTDPSETTLLTSYAKAAREAVEKHCRIAIPLQTVTMYVDRFPTKDRGLWWDGVRELPISELYQEVRAVQMPKPPLVSVTSVSTFDDSDVETTFASTNYYVDNADPLQQGRVVLRVGAVWPIGLRTANAVKFVFVAGYADGSVPESLRQAILGVGAYLYSHRGDCGGDCVSICGLAGLVSDYVIREPR